MSDEPRKPRTCARQELHVLAEPHVPGNTEQGSSGWWVRIYSNGENGFIGHVYTADKDEAMDDSLRFLEQKAREVPIAREQLTLAEAAKNVNRIDDINGRAPSKAYDNHLIPFFGGRTIMSTITTVPIKQFIEQQLKAGAGNATINRQLESLRRAFTVAIQDGRLASKPHIPRLKEDNVRTGWFERTQFEALLRHLPRRRKRMEAETADDSLIAFAEFGWITGWRLGEVRRLRWKNVDFVTGFVRLEPGTTKNGDGRAFPMTKALRAVLERRLVAAKAERNVLVDVDRERLVFTTKCGKAVGDFRKTWHRACRAAGIQDRIIQKANRAGRMVERRLPGLTFHDLRRTAVRRLVEEAGVSERVAMTLTGHKTRSVFDRYHIVSQRDWREAARRLDDLEAAAGTTS